jgi:hypothetical protein
MEFSFVFYVNRRDGQIFHRNDQYESPSKWHYHCTEDQYIFVFFVVHFDVVIMSGCKASNGDD